MEINELTPEYGLEYLGLRQLGRVHWNLPTPAVGRAATPTGRHPFLIKCHMALVR